MVKLTSKKPVLYNTKLTIKQFYEKRNKVLIVRDTGGLGDILMCRMFFEDFKRIMPDAYMVFAVPPRYFDAARNHPFIDEIVDSTQVDPNDYVVSYDITTACGKHEKSVAPFSDKNRSDIWANYCGVELQHHNMYLQCDPALTERCRNRMEQYRRHERGPLVLLCPTSAMKSKDLDGPQMNGVVQYLQEKDCFVLGLHKTKVHELEVPTIEGDDLTEFFAFVNAADYIITVDTGTFHVAGGLKKPTVGIFTWADSVTYGKYYDFIPVQKHRNWTEGWTCGPCYIWTDCCKCQTSVRKPCATELTVSDIVGGIEKMFKKWPYQRN